MQQTIMPDSATEIIEKGMTLKPPIGRFLKNVFRKSCLTHDISLAGMANRRISMTDGKIISEMGAGK